MDKKDTKREEERVGEKERRRQHGWREDEVRACRLGWKGKGRQRERETRPRVRRDGEMERIRQWRATRQKTTEENINIEAAERERKPEERACAGRGGRGREGGEENRRLPLPANSSPHTFPASTIILVFEKAFRNNFHSS